MLLQWKYGSDNGDDSRRGNDSGNEAFVLCPALKEVTLPCSVTSEDNAFPANTNVTRLNPKMESVENGGYVDAFKVNATVTELYQNAFDMLDLVNAERRKYGVQDLVMDTGLLETAMQRATECVIYNSHTRPNGFACDSANGRIMGENITRVWGNTTGSYGMVDEFSETPCEYSDGAVYQHRSRMCLCEWKLLLAAVFWNRYANTGKQKCLQRQGSYT